MTTSLEEPEKHRRDSLPGQHATDSSALLSSYHATGMYMCEESVLTGSPDPKNLSWKANRSQSLGFQGTVNEPNPNPDPSVYASEQDAHVSFAGLQDCHMALAQSQNELHTFHEDGAAEGHVPAHVDSNPALQQTLRLEQHFQEHRVGPNVNTPSMQASDEQLLAPYSDGPNSCPLLASHEQAFLHDGTEQAHDCLSIRISSEQLGLRDGIGQSANCLSSLSTLTVEFEEAALTVAATYTVLPGQLSSEHASGEFALGQQASHAFMLTQQENEGLVDADAVRDVLRSIDYEVTVMERIHGPEGDYGALESRECSILTCTAVAPGLTVAQHGAQGETGGSLWMQESSAFALSLSSPVAPADEAAETPPNSGGSSIPPLDGKGEEQMFVGSSAFVDPRDQPNGDLLPETLSVSRPQPEDQNIGRGPRFPSPAGKVRYNYRSPSPISAEATGGPLDIGEVRGSLRHVSPQSHKPAQGPRESQSPVLVGPVSVAARARAFNELVKRAAANKSPDMKSVAISRSRTCVKGTRPSAEEMPEANSGSRSASCAPSALSPAARYPPSVLAPLRKALQFDNVDNERRFQQKSRSPAPSSGAGTALPDPEPHAKGSSTVSTHGAAMTAPLHSVPLHSEQAWRAVAKHGSPHPDGGQYPPVPDTDSGPEQLSEQARKLEAGWVIQDTQGDHARLVGALEQRTQLPPSRIPRVSSTGSSRGTSSDGGRPARDSNMPHGWEPSSRIPGWLHDGIHTITGSQTLANPPNNEDAASSIPEAEPFLSPIKEVQGEDPKQERILYNMVVQAGTGWNPVTREEQAVLTNHGENERLAPPVSSEAGDGSGPVDKERLLLSPTASPEPHNGHGRLLYKMVVQGGDASPSEVPPGAVQTASRHATQSSGVSADFDAVQAGVAVETLAVAASTRENDMVQVLGGTEASIAVQSTRAGSASLRKGAVSTRLAHAKLGPTGGWPRKQQLPRCCVPLCTDRMFGAAYLRMCLEQSGFGMARV